jgi:glyoxylase-like metal-dependent hydrolase (beta-lactamase superfamily II)
LTAQYNPSHHARLDARTRQSVVNTLSHGLSWIDLLFRDRRNTIAAGLVQSPGGAAIVDPGPTSCLRTLDLGLQQQGVRWDDVRHILLTHIHLDHAGATGTIVRAHPHITVLVHERGVRHMIEPSRLLESASRLYGDQMDALWGEFAPVPQANIVSLAGGEQIEAGGRVFNVAYTPGHASHHVSFFDASTGVAFVGDVAGVSVGHGYVLAPTPPPDIDLEMWSESVDRMLAWSPSTLFLTHFGPVTRVQPHLAELLDHLYAAADVVRESLKGPGSDDEKSEQFSEWMRRQLRRQMSEAEVDAYVVAAGFKYLWFGLARYWKNRLGIL